MATTPLPGAVRAWTSREFQGPTFEQDSTVAIPAASVRTRVVANNADRVSLTFANVGPNDCQVLLGNFGTGVGLALPALTGMVNMEVRDDATLPSREWFSVSASGTTIYVLEVIRITPTPGPTGITTNSP